MSVTKIFVIRSIDYDGGRRGMTWEEQFCISRETAEEIFAKFSRPRNYGRGRNGGLILEPYESYEIKERQPKGFIKSVCHKFSMMMVEMSQEEVLP